MNFLGSMETYFKQFVFMMKLKIHIINSKYVCVCVNTCEVSIPPMHVLILLQITLLVLNVLAQQVRVLE